MAGGYPCCCLERFDSSVSGAESGGPLPPGSLLLSCECECLCELFGPETIRVDLNVPDDRSLNCNEGILNGKRCSDLSGTYFFHCDYGGGCQWHFKNENLLGALGMECYPDPMTGEFVTFVWCFFDGAPCYSGRWEELVQFGRTLGQDQHRKTPWGTWCLPLDRLHGLVLPGTCTDYGVCQCPVPDATATLYLV